MLLSLNASRWTGIGLGGRLQGVGLVCLTGLSFVPRLSHKAEYLFFGLLTLAAAVACVQRRWTWGRTPVDAPILLFSLWVLLTVPFAVDVGYSFSEWRKLVAHVLLFFWANAVLASPARSVWIRGVLWTVVAGTVLLAVYSLSTFVWQGGSWRDRVVRAAAPMSDYNWLSTYMVLSLPVVAAGWVIFRRTHHRALVGLSLTAGALAQLFSYTRAGWLGSFLQMCIGAWMVGRRAMSLSIMAAGIAAIVGLLIVAPMGYQSDTARSLTAESRTTVWHLSLQSIIEHPVVGVGYGNDTFIRVHAGREEARLTPHVHNTYLMIAMGSGIPALLLFGWVAAEGGRALYRAFRRAADEGERILLLAIFLAGFGFLVRNFFDYMLAGSLGALFWILMAVGFSASGAILDDVSTIAQEPSS